MYVNLANVSEIKFEDSFLVIKVAQNEIYYLLASNNKLEETYKATVTDLNNYSKDLKIIMKTKLIEQTNSSHESGLKENRNQVTKFNENLEKQKLTLKLNIQQNKATPVSQTVPETSCTGRLGKFFRI